MNKIKIASIHFPFSESGSKSLIGKFLSWDDAENALRRVKKPDLGYYKTDFVITYRDGETYQGRYDIGADAPSLAKHILGHIEMVRKFGDMKRTSQADVDAYNEFEEKYQIG